MRLSIALVEQITLRIVHDGDTFTTTDGLKVRVLGIDSCEMSTDAGPAARDYARSLMPVSSSVTLTQRGRFMRQRRPTEP